MSRRFAYHDPGEQPDAPRRKKPQDTETASLFDVPAQPKKEREIEPAYQPDSPTSREAARRIAPHTLAMRENVRNAITSAGERGMTRRELEGVTGYLTQTLCARLNELEQVKEIRKLTRLENNAITVVRREGCAIYVGKTVKIATEEAA